MEHIVEIAHARIRPFPNQPREYFDPTALSDLARSIKAAGLQNPITVRPVKNDPRHDYELVDGQRRWLACGINRQTTIRAWVRDDILNADDQFMISVISNFCREGHSPMEIAKAIARLRKRPEIAAIEKKELQAQAIGNVFGRSFGWVYEYESLLRLHPNLQAMLDPHLPDNKRLSFRAAHFIAELPMEVQLETAFTIFKKGMNRGQATSFARAKVLEHGAGADGRAASTRGIQYRMRALNAIRNISLNTEALLEIKMTEFEQSFAKQSHVEQESALFSIDNALEQLTTLRQSIARMLKKAA